MRSEPLRIYCRRPVGRPGQAVRLPEGRQIDQSVVRRVGVHDVVWYSGYIRGGAAGNLDQQLCPIVATLSLVVNGHVGMELHEGVTGCLKERGVGWAAAGVE